MNDSHDTSIYTNPFATGLSLILRTWFEVAFEGAFTFPYVQSKADIILNPVPDLPVAGTSREEGAANYIKFIVHSQFDSCHMRTQVPSAAVVYTPDCSVGEARVRTAVGRKSCRCTDTLTLLIRLGSSENRHQTVTDFRFWDSSGLRLCFRPSSQTKVRATLQGSSRLSQVMSSLCQLVCLISLSREDLPGVPFWSLFVRLWSFINDLWICVLYVLSLKTQRETQIKDVSCILAILLGPAFLWCPQHSRFRCTWTSCVSLLAPYESWEVLLLSLQTSSLQAWCSRPAGGQVWGHDLNLY